MSCNGVVSGLSLHNIVTVDADGGHESEGAEALRDNVRLNITIVVLASPDKATISLDHLSNNIVDQSVLVVQALRLHLVKVLLAVNAFKSVNKEAVILLENCVLA